MTAATPPVVVLSDEEKAFTLRRFATRAAEHDDDLPVLRRVAFRLCGISPTELAAGMFDDLVDAIRKHERFTAGDLHYAADLDLPSWDVADERLTRQVEVLVRDLLGHDRMVAALRLRMHPDRPIPACPHGCCLASTCEFLGDCDSHGGA